MSISRIATTRDARKSYAILIETGRGRYQLTVADLLTYDTARKIETELKRQASTTADSLPDVYVHVNRDGSLALATGQVPDIWPEDEAAPDVGIRSRL